MPLGRTTEWVKISKNLVFAINALILDWMLMMIKGKAIVETNSRLKTHDTVLNVFPAVTNPWRVRLPIWAIQFNSIHCQFIALASFNRVYGVYGVYGVYSVYSVYSAYSVYPVYSVYSVYSVYGYE